MKIENRPSGDLPQAKIKLKIENSVSRPPIVVVMGHVDHGKTTLLDYIRKTNLASKEAGGITQSIGAYVIEVRSKVEPKSRESETDRGIPRQMPRDDFANIRKITFIDTPGHEAFSKMRARGAKLADLGILVISADESVKPQTKEAIETLKETQTPFIVAINKIDKANADIEKIKQDLAQAGVLLEGYGGNISWQAISAKTGQGVDELLDLILLSAEMEQLTYDTNAKVSGVIIESRMDSSRGLSVSVIVKNGVLRVGDEITSQNIKGKVKILENFLGERVNELYPSSPALILGFENMPQIGEEFTGGLQMNANTSQISQISTASPSVVNASVNSRAQNSVLKADVSGSLEALSGIIKTMPEVKIISEEIGDITDGDVRNALNTKAVIIGFKVKVSKAAENLAKAQEIKIITSNIIYELIKSLEKEVENLKEPKINGELEILAVFGKKTGKGGRQIVGGKVNFGSFKNNLPVNIKRQEKIIGQGKILNLQRGKEDISQISESEECGILFESDIIINVGDKLIHET